MTTPNEVVNPHEATQSTGVSPENSPGHPASAPVPDDSDTNEAADTTTTTNEPADKTTTTPDDGENDGGSSTSSSTTPTQTHVVATDGTVYTIGADGRVTKQEDGHTYTIRDEALLGSIRGAAETGDVTGVSGATSEWANPGVFQGQAPNQGKYVVAEDGQTFRVSSDGTVSRQEGGRTFTISDDGLRDSVLEAARSGDTAGISGGASEWATPGVFDTPQDQTRQVVGPDGTSYRISAQGSVTTTDGSGTSQISDADLLDSVLEAGRGESAKSGFTFVSEPAEVETAPQPGSTGVDSRLAVRIAEALNSETMSSFTKDGIIVSRDSNGYVSVRDASGAGSAIYRRDGAILKADIPGLAVPRQELQRAGMQSAPVGDPSQRTANAFNFGRIALADKDWFQQQFDDLPEELGDRAARLDELAAIARANTTKWPPNTSGWVLKDGDGKQVTPQQFFLDLADRIASSAEANRRELGRVESVNQAIQDYLAADQAAQSPLGQTGVSDLDEMGYYGFSGDFLEVEGDLAAVAGNYRKLAAEWSERPDNELVGIPVIRPAGDSATIDPADYFRQQANRYGWHLGKATDCASAGRIQNRSLFLRGFGLQTG